MKLLTTGWNSQSHPTSAQIAQPGLSSCSQRTLCSCYSWSISNRLLQYSRAYYIRCKTFPNFHQLTSKLWTHLKHVCYGSLKKVAQTPFAVILEPPPYTTYLTCLHFYLGLHLTNHIDQHPRQSSSLTHSTSPQVEEQTTGIQKAEELLKHNKVVQREFPHKTSCKHT